ncbi:hypothetical protein [Staphylococcus petrasii]|uniref:hypothetical protein n=1 Tax=Staphylococcus petrasii TaxID=1276936 RepID=UPI001F592198|nr:hypothetical protein [Staphylococcus petrasii]MCI2773432.1 hypothetical protein [Staphylococcus petrasii]
MILSNTVHQKYKFKTGAKTPTEVQQELRKLGVNGFVVKVAGSRVTMLVDREHINKNRKCVRNGRTNIR